MATATVAQQICFRNTSGWMRGHSNAKLWNISFMWSHSRVRRHISQPSNFLEFLQKEGGVKFRVCGAKWAIFWLFFGSEFQMTGCGAGAADLHLWLVGRGKSGRDLNLTNQKRKGRVGVVKWSKSGWNGGTSRDCNNWKEKTKAKR